MNAAAVSCAQQGLLLSPLLMELTSVHVQACSVQLPVAAPSKGLLSAGNMASNERPSRAITPLGQAAAGMALCERRWFHVARSAAPRCAPVVNSYSKMRTLHLMAVQPCLPA